MIITFLVIIIVKLKKKNWKSIKSITILSQYSKNKLTGLLKNLTLLCDRVENNNVDKLFN